MELDEWVMRTIFALVTANVFLAGLYFMLRGYFQHYLLTRFWTKKVGSLTRGNKFRASVQWYKHGQMYSSIQPGLFSMRKKETISIFVEPSGFRIKLNMWFDNGKGTMLGGVLLLASSAILLFLLF